MLSGGLDPAPGVLRLLVMELQSLAGSPLFWLLTAVVVGAALMLFFFSTDARLRRRLGRLRRQAGDIRLPADGLTGSPGPVRRAAERALAEFDAGKPYDAAGLFERAAGQAQGQVRAELMNLAAVCHHVGNRLEPAAERYERAAALAVEAGAKQVGAAGYANLALLRLAQAEPELARAALEQALTLDRESGNQVQAAVGLGRLGLVFQARGETARALDLHLEALAINEALDNRRGIAYDLGRIGLAYQAHGEQAQALEYYARGLAAARKAGDRVTAGEFLGNIGLLQFERGESEAALGSLLGALALFGEMRDTARAVNTVKGLKLVRERLGADAFAAGCRRFGLKPPELARLAGLLERISGEDAPGPVAGKPARPTGSG